jgi:phosphoribosylglycinamide formyltransferase-1
MSDAGPAREGARFVVLASGRGTNLQAVMDACASGALRARVVAVFSDRPEAECLRRAREGGAEAMAVPPSASRRESQSDSRREARSASRLAYDSSLADLVAAHGPDWVLLLGWMRILSRAFLDRFPSRVLNLHPALPGTFPGTKAIERAWEASRDGRLRETGVMVHLVPDEGVDSGPVLGVARLPVDPRESLEALEARVHEVEHRLVVEVLKRIVEGQGGGL